MSEQMNPKAEYPIDDKRIKEVVSALRTIEDPKGLTEDEFNWLAIHGMERFSDDGDLIFSQGTPPRHLMFILGGDVLVHRHSS
jgi:CRP-like cAMP-binding protein